jgi:hypothetical protein
MRLVRSALLATCLAGGATLLACGGDAPRMRVMSTHVRSGDSVVVRFDAPPVAARARGDVWLTLVPQGTSDDFVGERIVIDEGAADATVPAGDEGVYELRLVDQSPRRLSRVVARARVDVDRPAVARNEAPAWYW